MFMCRIIRRGEKIVNNFFYIGRVISGMGLKMKNWDRSGVKGIVKEIIALLAFKKIMGFVIQLNNEEGSKGKGIANNKVNVFGLDAVKSSSSLGYIGPGSNFD